MRLKIVVLMCEVCNPKSLICLIIICMLIPNFGNVQKKCAMEKNGGG